MKKFLTTTAAALLLSTPVYAEAHAPNMFNFQYESTQSVYASELIGMRVYAAEGADATVMDASSSDNWNDIGEINDVVLTRDGKVAAVIVGVGGFLGMGEKDVSMQMDQIKFVKDNDDEDDFFLVVNANKQMLNDAKPFARMMQGDMETNTAMKTATHGTTTADVEVENGDERTVLVRPMVQRDGYVEAAKLDLTSENLTGARVYGINDEDVGEISKLILSTSGKVEKAVIDVGGFLGLGEKPVAVTFDELNILRSSDGKDFRVYIDSTQNALEEQPEYDG